jgi:hypothetical protein
MSDAERDPAGEQFNFPTAFGRVDPEPQAPTHARKLRLVTQLAEQGAALRASALVLGDRIECLGRLAARRRVG